MEEQVSRGGNGLLTPEVVPAESTLRDAGPPFECCHVVPVNLVGRYSTEY